jgi:hypothetical protein
MESNTLSPSSGSGSSSEELPKSVASSGATSPELAVSEPKDFKWTTVRERFCEEYLVDFDGANAYRRAANWEQPPSGKRHAPVVEDGAAQRAYKLLQYPEIRQRIAENVKGLNDQTRLRIEEVEAEIRALAHSDVGEMFDLDADELRLLPMRQWPKLARRCVSTIKAKKYPAGVMQPLSDEDFRIAEQVAGQYMPGSPAARVMGRLLQAYKDAQFESYTIVELKLWDKNSALEKAGKILKMFTEILEHRGIITFAEVSRKVSPEEWTERFREQHPLTRPPAAPPLLTAGK